MFVDTLIRNTMQKECVAIAITDSEETRDLGNVVMKNCMPVVYAKIVT